MDANNPSRVWLGDEGYDLLAISYHARVDLPGHDTEDTCDVCVIRIGTWRPPETVESIAFEIPGYRSARLTGPWRLTGAYIESPGCRWSLTYRREGDGWFTVTNVVA
jgi:hypothetical protein